MASAENWTVVSDDIINTYLGANGTQTEDRVNQTKEPLVTREVIISLVLPYAVIFFLAIVGNSLVIFTLSRNRRMKTVTNAFLLNLAISDLLLGVVCMPFTLIGTVMREFLFGSFMCRLIPYLQAVSVSVSSWTLVSMSVERWYAICRPLKSRGSRQSWGHTHKMIGTVWIFSLLIMTPIAFLSELQPMNKPGKFKCRETWPSEGYLIGFTMFLDAFLFIIPSALMTVTYFQIASKLWRSIKRFRSINDGLSRSRSSILENSISPAESGHKMMSADEDGSAIHSRDESTNATKSRANETNKRKNGDKQKKRDKPLVSLVVNFKERRGLSSSLSIDTQSRASRTPRVMTLRTNLDKGLMQKRQTRVIKMLFVVVLEFFICWTPLHVINTIALFYPKALYLGLGYKGISFFQLLAFVSSCINPIIYCFMNSKFRQSFRATCGCFFGSRRRWGQQPVANSTLSPINYQ